MRVTLGENYACLVTLGGLRLVRITILVRIIITW